MLTRAIDLEKYHQLALQKQKEHRVFLAGLRKKALKNLDKIVQEVHTEVFNEVDCAACGNCCKILEPLFTEADITRIAKHFRMRLPIFEEMYLKADEDGDKVFNGMPCPFLGESNLCLIYDIRPKACREFPHTDRKKIYQINHLTIKKYSDLPGCLSFCGKAAQPLMRQKFLDKALQLALTILLNKDIWVLLIFCF